MNIFVTDPCPIHCAKNLDDVRVCKMVTESAQILCTAVNLKAGKQVTPYKNSHPHNKSVHWAMRSSDNWNWLYRHAMALSDEYTVRSGKVIKTRAVLMMVEGLGELYFPPIGPTPFVNKAHHLDKGIDYSHVEDVYLAYQLYLNHRWDTDDWIPTWYGKAA